MSLSDSEVEKFLIRLDAEVSKIKEELFRISWYMRGGVTVKDLLHLYSHDDLTIFSKIIGENIENTKNTQMPLL